MLYKLELFEDLLELADYIATVSLDVSPLQYLVNIELARFKQNMV